eukprot:CAMPEP_0203819506 /NCGR_PEP_ID=MMETSP0115-20131106/36192_1 /ASSEMBLY_ACC=CAM_ASM_000227 /TAXON_ID=33651 /ORGANISM="Bicosoecid sp, Strain ms1" /LENGTH=104 /DNA_ID=CAMNT_0050728491 /DNA_START=47 /DNA_END=358 /DNA_ORIENTATION=-
MGNSQGTGEEDWADEAGYMPSMGDELDLRTDHGWVRARVCGVLSETLIELAYSYGDHIVRVRKDLLASLDDFDQPGRHTPGQVAPKLVRRERDDAGGGGGGGGG